jgi:hypothetical protein
MLAFGLPFSSQNILAFKISVLHFFLPLSMARNSMN